MAGDISKLQDWEASGIEGYSVDAEYCRTGMAGAKSKVFHFCSLQGQAVRNLTRGHHKGHITMPPGVRISEMSISGQDCPINEHS